MLSLAPSYNRALGENISITIYSAVVSFTRGRGSSPGTCPHCVSIRGAQTPRLQLPCATDPLPDLGQGA